MKGLLSPSEPDFPIINSELGGWLDTEFTKRIPLMKDFRNSAKSIQPAF